MNLACAISARRLVDDPYLRSDHIDRCLRCQVEAIRYRHLVRRLAAIGHELVEAPPGLLPAVVAGLPTADTAPKKPAGREAAAAAAGLAAAVGAVALWRRSVSA